MFFGEEKSVIAGTKRRRATDSAIINSAASTRALSKRVTRLSKVLRASNPTHLYQSQAGAAFTTISLVGSIYEIGANISQGDDYNQRFGSHVDFQRIVLKGLIQPGGTSTNMCPVRITCFRGQSGLVFASNLNGSYNPIADSTSTQLLFDKYYPITPALTSGSPGATRVHISIKTKHRQKYSGAGAGTTTGGSLYFVVQSNVAAGTSAPTWAAGVLEEYFKP